MKTVFFYRQASTLPLPHATKGNEPVQHPWKCAHLPLLLALLPHGLSACSDGNDEDSSAGTRDGTQDTPGDGGSPGKNDSALYVITNEIYSADDSSTYLSVLDTLDSPKVDLDEAIEFAGGRATVDAFNGWVFVAPPLSQTIERYSLDADGRLRKDDTFSLSTYGVDEAYIGDWGATFISEKKAYYHDSTNGQDIIWNPTTMEIEGVVDLGDFELVREGWIQDGSPGIVRGDRLFRTVYWMNWDTYEWSEESILLVYDTKTDELIDVVNDDRCPSLGNRISADEDGTLYFSNWIWNVGATLVYDAKESCVLRIRAGEETFDPDWRFVYNDVTDGREGAMFAYFADGKALMSVFYDDNVRIDDETVAPELLSTDNWRMWVVDLDRDSAEELPGLGWNSGAISTFTMENRSFLFVPKEGWVGTEIYEVSDGEAHLNFEVKGWSYLFDKLR